MKEYEKLEYLGETYTYRSGEWVDSKTFVACESIQNKLNKLYAENIDITMLSMKDIIIQADKFKASSSYDLAIRFYEYASKEADKNTLAHIMPKLTSCYRKNNRPDKAIWLLTFANHKYGPSIVTPALLTSAAAAYCDLRDYKRAIRCCERAKTNLNGHITEELRMVYKRIQSEMKNNTIC